MNSAASHDSAAGHLARLIRIPTVSSASAPAGDDVFGAFRAEFEACYPLVHATLHVDRVGPRGLRYRWRPDDDATPAPRPLVLMAHLDVVPADEADGWTHPPFAGVIAPGVAGDAPPPARDAVAAQPPLTVFGRGALDDKGPLVAIFEAVESLIADGFRPARPLVVALGSDEETLGTGGEDAAAAVAADDGEPLLVLDEGGAVIDPPIPFVRGDSAMIGVAEKGYATLRLLARAEPGHASTPSARSAPSRIATAVARLERHRARPRATVPVRAMLAALAGGASAPARAALRALVAAPWIMGRLFAALGGEPAASVRTTCAVTMLEGGSAPNVIAAEASATLNVRIVPGETVRGAVRRVRRIIGDPTISIETLAAGEPTPVAPTRGPEFAAIARAISASYPEARPVPYLVLATTDARHFHRRWPNVYRFAPLRMSRSQRAGIHGVDECVTVDALDRGVRFHRALLLDLLGPADANGEARDAPRGD